MLWAALALASWDIQFAEPLVLTREVAVIDVDGEATSAATVAALRARGVAPLCYISVGTHEDWRADAAAFPAAVLGKDWPEWPGERYLDIRDPRVLPLMRSRIADCAAKGFAGVDGDNQDLHGGQSGFPISAADQVAYSSALADAAHAAGLLWGQKNAADLVPQMVRFADFIITEDCAADGWCSATRPYAESKKPVYAIEYDDNKALDWRRACGEAKAGGLTMILKDRALSGAVHSPCP